MEPQEIAALIDPAAEQRYRWQLCREAWKRGHAAGFREGYEQSAKDLERNWQVVAKRVKETASAPTNAELKARRAA